ncbi:endonuclease/exonuclease/phosphatase family protein [uncultured Cohaesibacter sp.]|uniref:endonuclease/exonuclease/phosphatase family protein n=1 Tax=uncultured Cohaesibacter sp. TaxID=1002546 RepID=UPI00292F9202|nr:endonuclease/exonuclease/phosphatase family protein [uncultured Cohaesibacter sp.]
MIKRLMGLVELAFFLAALGWFGATGIGLLGRFVRLFDLINHFQLVLVISAMAFLAASFVWRFSGQFYKRAGRALFVLSIIGSMCLIGPEILHRGTQTLFASEANARPSGNTTIKLMSFNLYMATRDAKGLTSSIIKVGPDLVTLQEYAPNRFKRQPDLKREYPYQARCKSWRTCSLAILSKYPLSEITSYRLDSEGQKNPLHGKMLAATMKAKGAKPVRVYSLHLSWPLPLSEKKLQFEKLAEIILKERERYPLQVIAGDFNSTGWAYAVDRFAANVGMERRDQFVPTFPSPNSRIKGIKLPAFLSLDHILTSQDIKASKVVRVSASVGDHWPIMTRLTLP